MNSIEHLRYVARASGADALALSVEAGHALGSVARQDPKGLLTAARRLLHAQPRVGPLWWLCSRMAVASNPAEALDTAVTELRGDRTAREFAHSLADRSVVGISGWPDTILRGLRRRGDARVLVLDVEGQAMGVVRYLEDTEIDAASVDGAQLSGLVLDADLVVVEASAAGAGAMMSDVGSFGLVAAARAQGVPVWAVIGLGRHLPEAYFAEIQMRTHDPDLPPWLSAHDVIPYGLIDLVVTNEGMGPISSLADPSCPMAPELLR